jgi:hypothetical protein
MTLSSLIAHQNRRDDHPIAAPDLSLAPQNRRVSNRHPEQAAVFAASEGYGTGRVVAPDLYHSCAGDQLGALASLLVKLLTSTVNKVTATAMPIGMACIRMIQGNLEEVKIRGPARWWFSTSQSGGFRPDCALSALNRQL